MKSLSIGKAIYTILSSNEELTEILGDNKIFPLIVNTDTQFPFIVYKRIGVNVLETKDKFIAQESVTVQLIVVANKYNQGVDIADKVATILYKARGTYNNINIVDASIEDIDEEFNEDAFTQILTIRFLIR